MHVTIPLPNLYVLGPLMKPRVAGKVRALWLSPHNFVVGSCGNSTDITCWINIASFVASVPAINSASIVLRATVLWTLVDQEIGEPNKRKR